MKVIGIDPGYDRLGIAILEGNTLLYSACLTTPSSLPFHERLTVLAQEVDTLVRTYAPQEMALEKLYFNSNQKTAMFVAQMIGALVFVAGTHHVPIYEYTPPQIKVACTSNGRADKKQVMTMIPLLVKLSPQKRLDDEYDAIAVALTHLAHRG